MRKLCVPFARGKIAVVVATPADISSFTYLLKYTFAVLPGRASAEDSTARQPCWAPGVFIIGGTFQPSLFPNRGQNLVKDTCVHETYGHLAVETKGFLCESAPVLGVSIPHLQSTTQTLQVPLPFSSKIKLVFLGPDPERDTRFVI